MGARYHPGPSVIWAPDPRRASSARSGSSPTRPTASSRTHITPGQDVGFGTLSYLVGKRRFSNLSGRLGRDGRGRNGRRHAFALWVERVSGAVGDRARVPFGPHRNQSSAMESTSGARWTIRPAEDRARSTAELADATTSPASSRRSASRSARSAIRATASERTVAAVSVAAVRRSVARARASAARSSRPSVTAMSSLPGRIVSATSIAGASARSAPPMGRVARRPRQPWPRAGQRQRHRAETRIGSAHQGRSVATSALPFERRSRRWLLRRVPPSG